MLHDEISLSVGFGEVRTESYEVKMDKLLQDEITPPPSPDNGPRNRRSNAQQLKNGDDDVKMKDTKNEFVPFNGLNAWHGKKWTGPNFKYDEEKSVEENNKFFEHCYDKAV